MGYNEPWNNYYWQYQFSSSVPKFMYQSPHGSAQNSNINASDEINWQGILRITTLLNGSFPATALYNSIKHWHLALPLHQHQRNNRRWGDNSIKNFLPKKKKKRKPKIIHSSSIKVYYASTTRDNWWLVQTSHKSGVWWYDHHLMPPSVNLFYFSRADV